MDKYIVKKLYGYQEKIDELKYLYINKRLPKDILFSGVEGVGKSILAFHLVNIILSENEDNEYDIKNYQINENNKSFKLLASNTHPNFYLLKKYDDKKNIEISQIRELKNFVYKSSLLNKPKIVFIDSAEHLSVNSSSAILKIMEEHIQNIFFFIIYSKNKFLIDTVKSRCVEYSLSLSNEYIENIINDYFDRDIYNNIPNIFKKLYLTPLNYVNLINFCRNTNLSLETLNLDKIVKVIVKDNLYKSNKVSYDEIKFYIELYCHNEFIHKKKINVFKYFHHFNKNYSDAIKYNLDVDPVFLELETNLFSK